MVDQSRHIVVGQRSRSKRVMRAIRTLRTDAASQRRHEGKVAAIQAVVAQMSNDALAGLTDEERQRARLVLEGLITALEKALGE